MADFEFIQNKITEKWLISAPRRANRPDDSHKSNACPFCLGCEKDEKEVYRVGGEWPDSNWQIRVLANKFPFAPIHEVIIHSPDHHKNFGELEDSQAELVFKTYRQRFQTHKDQGQVYIFNNTGEKAGESLPHPHSQLAVIPQEMSLDIPALNPEDFSDLNDRVETNRFYVFCPKTSQWPDEVWLKPKSKNSRPKDDRPLAEKFGDITDEQITDLANILSRLVQIMSKRHGQALPAGRQEFPYNFYIYPGGDWYLRLIPRIKILGGFELGTGVFVNTQDSKDTLDFLKKNLEI